MFMVPPCFPYAYTQTCQGILISPPTNRLITLTYSSLEPYSCGTSYDAPNSLNATVRLLARTPVQPQAALVVKIL